LNWCRRNTLRATNINEFDQLAQEINTVTSAVEIPLLVAKPMEEEEEVVVVVQHQRRLQPLVQFPKNVPLSE
jgi:hypothetical protein